MQSAISGQQRVAISIMPPKSHLPHFDRIPPNSAFFHPQPATSMVLNVSVEDPINQ
jgi:hypothetical protein